MRRQTLLIVALSTLVLMAALFMGWAARRTVEPAATPTPAPTVAVAATPTGDGSQMGGGVIDLGQLTVTLPEDWRYVLNAWPDAAPAELAGSAPLLTAWHGAAGFRAAPLHLTLLSVERNALSLERYASDVAEQLIAAEGVSDVAAVIANNFRSDTLPVAYLSYTKESSSGRQYGYQIATFDAHGDNIVIATLLTQSSNSGEEILRTLVKSLRFADMPAVPQETAVPQEGV